CKIEACGELKPGDPLKLDDGTGDPYDELLEDEPTVDISKPETVFKAVDEIKAIGTKFLKQGDLKIAFAKY
ncbi:hypothetical protein WICPIJ_004577, partial [Wickerhamomyces pijperi]